jgi:hypothetical protein
MNKLEQIRFALRNRQLFKLGSPRNVVRMNTGSTWEHEFCKWNVAFALVQVGHDVITEAVFKRGRCDVVDLTDGIIYEIVHSEKEESLVRKSKVYPLPIKIVRVVDVLSGLKPMKPMFLLFLEKLPEVERDE